MKTYTFNFDNKTGNNARNIPTTASYSSIISDIIRSNVKKNNPWLFGAIDPDYSSEFIITTPKKKKTIDIDITIPTRKSYSTSFADLAKAIRILDEYERDNKDDYDFKLPNGTPVKLFADEIQIGFDLIPLNGFTKAIYDKLSENTKKNIIDITIIISKD